MDLCVLQTDPVIQRLIEAEEQRQKTTLNLIASENYTDPAIHAAQATVLSHKYAEGYPKKRYYPGCEIVDQIEQIAQERCKALFNAEHANVQPLAGSAANFAAFSSVLKPGDTILGMSLAHGGHLTHGHPVNFSGRIYTIIQYGVCKDTQLIDFEQIKQLAHEHKPKLIIAGASAYSRVIDFKQFAEIARQVGALLLVDMAHIAGLVAGGVHPNPTAHADLVTSTTHKTLRGPRGALILAKKELGTAVDRAIMPGTQGGPFLQQIAAKAICFELALKHEFKLYQQQTVKNAQTLAKCLKNYGFEIVTGGTDTHLFVVDLTDKQLSGREVEQRLESVGITASRSCIPFDPLPPAITSGIRFGTPALTTRGMNEADMELIATLISETVHTTDTAKLAAIAQEVKSFAQQFPLFSTKPILKDTAGVEFSFASNNAQIG